MSAQRSQNRPAPLTERSQSQNNTLAIRIVPYTPPRIHSGGLSPGQQPDAAEGSYRGSNNQPSSGEISSRSRESWGSGGGKGRHASPTTVALSSPSSPSLLLVGPDDEDVSDLSDQALRPPHSPVLVSPSQLARTPIEPNSEPLTASHPRPLSRNRNYVAVHSDKTFSLVRHGPLSNSSRNLTSPPVSYSSRTSSSVDRPSLGAWTDERPSSPLSTPSPDSSTTQLAEDPITSSPWNYRIVGGLRKVPKTPDLKQKATRYPASPAVDSPLSPLPELASPQETDSLSRSLAAKTSFASTQTKSTTSETTNYKVYGHSPAQISSDSLVPSSSDQSNYEILGVSSPPAPFSSSPPGTSDSKENYVLHGEPSPSPSLVAVVRRPRPTYSQESLVVPPLRPGRKRSHEDFGYYKQRSRSKLRARAESIKTIRSIKSISSVISQEATQALLAAPLLLNLQGTPPFHNTAPGDSRTQLKAQDSWEALRTIVGSSAAHSRSPTNSPPPRPIQMIQAHPHQWSSQLSTVMSESEVGSSRGHSRSASHTSTGNFGGHRRRSSAGWPGSVHSRQLQSISSSSAAGLDDGQGDSPSISQSGSIERPYPTHARAGPSGARMVQHHDEYGDGLADLDEVSHRPSKTGLSSFFASSDSLSRNLSSSSSRANSFNSAVIPAWARLYYGSGERRFLTGQAGSLSVSEASDSRPSSSAIRGSGSPNTDHFPLRIQTSRRRANQVVPPPENRPFSNSASMEITGAPPPVEYGVLRTLKKKTSSIWSPHLRIDRRSDRYSVWDPPSVSWSADSGPFGKRNAQVVLFIVGFIFPFAWMIAAFLPLPPNPTQMLETSQTRSPFGPVDYTHQLRLAGETRYASARWWRNLNRVMSIIGLFIIGAIVALVVVGLQQGWAIRN